MKNNIIKALITVLISNTIFIQAFAATTEEVKQNIIRQAQEMGVEPAIVLSLAKTESGFNQKARSAGGHIGVFQLSPATAKTMGLNPYDLDDNVKGGITYYKNMYNKFGSMELALAAYNAGPVTIQRCNNCIPSRTKPFVDRIMKDYQNYKEQGYN